MSRNKKNRAGVTGGVNKAQIETAPPNDAVTVTETSVIDEPHKADAAKEPEQETPQKKSVISKQENSEPEPQIDEPEPEASQNKEPEKVKDKNKDAVPVKLFSKLFKKGRTVDKAAVTKTNPTRKATTAESEKTTGQPETDLFNNIKAHVLSANPVFVRAVAAVPILGAAVSLKSGLMLSGAMFLTVVLLSMIMYPLNRFVPRGHRFVAAFIAAGIVITPVAMLSAYLAPTVATMCGIYLPLLAVCAIPMVEKKHCGRKYGFAKTVRDAAFDGVGFAFAAIIFSTIREILGKGTVYGRALPYISGMKFSFALLPAGAFVLLGLLAALFRKIYGIKDDGQDSRD